MEERDGGAAMPQGSSEGCHNLARTWRLWPVAPLSQVASLSHVLRSPALPDSRALFFLISSCQMRHEVPLGHSGLSIESPGHMESYVNFSCLAEAPLPHSLTPIPTRSFPGHGLDTLSPLFLGTSSPALAALREAVGRYISCSLLSVEKGLPCYRDQALSLAARTCEWHRRVTAAQMGEGE